MHMKVHAGLKTVFFKWLEVKFTHTHTPSHTHTHRHTPSHTYTHTHANTHTHIHADHAAVVSGTLVTEAQLHVGA